MERRTYVLVHGAWHGGWCWREVAARLASRGHIVYTPTQTGLGERRHLMSANITIGTFVDDIANAIEAEELDEVILVGHSFGGRSACGVADRMPERLHRLVFLDSGLPESGLAPIDGLPAEVRAARLRLARESSGGLSVPPPSAASFGISDSRLAAWVERRLSPHPLRTYTEPLELAHPLANGVAVTYIRCTRPAYAPNSKSATYARARKDWQYLELDAGHDAMVTAPEALTAMLLGLS